MNSSQFKTMFPRASQSTLEVNGIKEGDASCSTTSHQYSLPTSNPKRIAKQPNKTEAEFGLMLEAQKQRGEILDYFYEGITLHWGDGMSYTADWVVYPPIYTVSVSGVPYKPKIFEIKGGHIWSRDSVRFKGCRAAWKNYYDFELWQKKKGSWTRLL